MKTAAKNARAKRAASKGSKRLNNESAGRYNGNSTPKLTRTTIFLADVLNDNLSALALRTGDSKSVLVREAVAELLKKRGLKPFQKPEVHVTYSRT